VCGECFQEARLFNVISRLKVSRTKPDQTIHLALDIYIVDKATKVKNFYFKKFLLNEQ